jgi:anti-sigma regulatory factor (Ser/Thr protein kinase)
MEEGPTLSFRLQLPPQARMVSIVRRFVEESFEKLVCDVDEVHRISLAVHELLENAAKYSVGKHTGLRVRIEPHGAASIEMTNETTPEHVARLRACVGEIQAAAEPFAHYQALMRRTVAVDEESGLGLARIRAEGDLNLTLEVNGNMVTIIASG